MNLLESVYCNQFYELQPKGKAHSARANGTVLVSLSLMFNFFVLLALLMWLFPNFQEFIEDEVIGSFGNSSGRTIGRVIAALSMGLFYFVVRYTLGTEKRHSHLIKSFRSLSEEEQKKISKKGLQYFFVSLGLLLIPILILIL